MKEIASADVAVDLVDSVTLIFMRMAGLRVVVAEQIEGKPRSFPSDISALITVTSTTLSGTVSLHCNMELARQISMAMVEDMHIGRPAGESGDEIRDALGEMANIVVGNFKSSLSEAVGETLRMTVPVVIVGKHHVTQRIANGRWFAVKFDVHGLPLVAEVLLEKDA